MTPLKIVTTGLAVTYPFGGVFWDYLQYPLGFSRLGHHVFYLEDTRQWCYDPVARTYREDGSANAAAFNQALCRLAPGLGDRWFYRDARGVTYGRSWEDVARFCRAADLFVNVSAACTLREEYSAAQRLVLIDSDPMYTQQHIPAYMSGTADEEHCYRVDILRRYDTFFTFGENFGAADCRIPQGLFHWVPTRQPIVLDRLAARRRPHGARRRVLTTVGSWGPSESQLCVDGIRYFGKNAEFEHFLALPSSSAAPLELALSGDPPAAHLLRHGWRLRDAYEVSRDPEGYLDYLADSLGEWSVAKNAYVASRSGWFSCRTACYLALGVPAVVQDTGFSKFLPTGEGLLAFTTPDEAAEAIASVAAEPEKHSAAAEEIARAFFDSDKVLTRLLDQALGS